MNLLTVVFLASVQYFVWEEGRKRSNKAENCKGGKEICICIQSVANISKQTIGLTLLQKPGTACAHNRRVMGTVNCNCQYPFLCVLMGMVRKLENCDINTQRHSYELSLNVTSLFCLQRCTTKPICFQFSMKSHKLWTRNCFLLPCSSNFF